jgi:carotenoid cleavage dioxygenase-like enzyme
MIHGLRIKDGKATYVSRFVKTSRLKQEEYFGGSKFMKVYIKKVKVHTLSEKRCLVYICKINTSSCMPFSDWRS